MTIWNGLAHGVFSLSLGLALARPAFSTAQVTAPDTAPTPPVNSVSGLTWAAKSLVALGGSTVGAPLSIELTGSVVWVSGLETETGTARLVASGPDQSRVEIDLANGSRIQTRSLRHHTPRGAERATGELAVRARIPDGMNRARALHNDWTPAVWFLPALGPLASLQATLTLNDPRAGEVRVADLGREQLAWTEPDGSPGTTMPVEHLRFTRWLSRQTPHITAEVAGLSTSDLYLDPTTLLPVELRYTQHPANDLQTSDLIEIRYVDYRSSSDLEVPFRIERWRNGVMDFAITVEDVRFGASPDGSNFVLAGGGQ